MFDIGTQWNPLQVKLKEIILKKDRFEELKELLWYMHSLLHTSSVYGLNGDSFMDEVLDGIEDRAFRTMPTAKDDTIAWNLWHITRIEDLTANYLIAKSEQVLDDGWLSRLKISVKDTGNAMSDSEIIDLSSRVDKDSLIDYRNAVGLRTKEIIGKLRPETLREKVAAEGLKKIAEVGGVLPHPDSKWLLDFWGKKTIAGIFMMPITRHQIVHLNDSRRLKKVLSK